MTRFLFFCISCLCTLQLLAQKELVLSDSLAQAGDFEQSIQLLEKFTATNKKQNFTLAQTYFQQSYNYLQLHQYDKALDYNELSLNIYQSLYYEFLAKNYLRYGTIFLQKKEYESALDNLLQAMDLPHESAQFTGILQGYIGAVYSKMGNYKKAETYYDASLESFAIDLEEEHKDIATTYLNIGNLFYVQERFTDAQRMYRKALEIEKVLDESPIRQARVHQAIAVNSLVRAQDYEESLINYQQASTLFQDTYKNAHPDIAECLLGISKIYREQGKLEEAKKVIVEAQGMMCPKLLESDFKTLPSEDDFIWDRALMSEILIEKSILLTKEYDRTGDIKFLKLALQSAEKGINIFEGLLSEIFYEDSRIKLMEQNADFYEQGIAVAYALLNQTNDRQYAERAFILSEKGKSRVLQKLMQESMDRKAAIQIHQLEVENSELQSSLVRYETLLLKDGSNKMWQDSISYFRRNYKTFIQQLEALNSKNEKIADVTNIEEVQSNLDQETLMLSYYVGEMTYYIFAIDAASFSLQAFPQDSVISFAKKVKIHTLFKKASILEEIGKTGVGVYSSYNDILKAKLRLDKCVNNFLKAIKKEKKIKYNEYSVKLYGKLIYPIEPFLKSKKKLIIIPHQNLNFLPFETLSKNLKVGKIRFKKLDYLIEDFAIHYHYSASLYLNSKQKPYSYENNVDNFLGVAPIFSDTSQTGYVWDSENFVFDSTYQEEVVLRDAFDFNTYSFKELKYSENEVLNIAKLFAKKQKGSRALMHELATESAFKEQASKYRFVHIASHSFVDRSNHKLSGIAFAQPDEFDFADDGILFAPETYRMALNADLLVLSSCESGIGLYAEGEGPMTLTRGFIYGGTPNIVCSLWKVYDKHTSTLMVKFYEEILKGKTYSEALRSAKLKMIKSSKTASPRKWSGFVLVGND